MSGSLTRSLGSLAVVGLALAGCARETSRSQPPSDRSEPGPASSCVEEYGPETLSRRAFAFDGTIIAVEIRKDPKLPPPEEGVVDEGIPWVAFSVHRWYRGGSAPEAGVWIEHLNVQTSVETISGTPGTRLLVAGQPRWGGDPMDDAIAWACGFTQPYTDEAAADWAAVFSS
jgi:hypothetical protein